MGAEIDWDGNILNELARARRAGVMDKLKKRVDIRAGLLGIYICLVAAPLYWRRLPFRSDLCGNLPGIIAGVVLFTSAVIAVLMAPRLARRDPSLKSVMIAVVAAFVFLGGAIADFASVLDSFMPSHPSLQNGQKHCHFRWRSASSWRPGV